MSSDSTSDGAGEFDFGAWCPVCERQIPPDVYEEDNVTAVPVQSTSTAKNKKHSGKTSHAVNGPSQHHGPRRKNSTKKKNSNHSSNSLHALTAVSPVLQPTEPELEPPSGLYCSEECRRIDEMRSRLALSQLGSSSSSASTFRPPPPPQLTRSLSNTSSTTMDSTASNPWDGLHFSTRRPSRGAVGGYSYRPSLMARVPSLPDSVNGRTSFSSSDSLVSLGMGEADERSERGYGGTRPPSALSAFKLMTPIASPMASPTWFPQQPTTGSRSRAPLPRAKSDSVGVGAAAAGARSARMDRRSQSSQSKKAVDIPPLPSPEAVLGPSSVPSNLMARLSLSLSPAIVRSSDLRSKMHMLPPSIPVKTQETDGPKRTSSSASLALMGTSMSRSLGSKNGWSLAPQRTASTLSLTGLVAQGEIVPQSEPATLVPSPPLSSQPLPKNRRSSSSSHSRQRLSTSASSQSSVSTAHSHWSASQRSTGTSTDYANDSYDHYSKRQASSSSLSQQQQQQPVNRRRPSRGLMMTPSSSSLVNMALDQPADRTPTQSLSIGNGMHLLADDSQQPKTTARSLLRVETDERGNTIKRASRSSRQAAPPLSALQPNSSPLANTNRSRSSADLAGAAAPLHADPYALTRVQSHPGHTEQDPDMAIIQTGPGRKNWQWDSATTTTYPALDLAKLRSSKKASDDDDKTTTGNEPRKRLFYFDDAS